MMIVQVYLGLNLIELHPERKREFPVAIEDGSTIQDLCDHFKIDLAEDVLILVNEKRSNLRTVLQGGDRIMLYPTLAGG